MVVSRSGDIGIANPKPTEKLVVGGNVSSSGVGYFDDGIQVKPADHDRILTTFNASATFAEQFILEHFDGNVVFRNPRGSMQMSSSLNIKDDIELVFGDSNDMKLFHVGGGNSFIENNEEHLIIVNNENDHDIYLKCDNGSGGTTNYITLDGSSATTIHQRPAFFGTSFTSATTTLHVSSSGVNGILIDEDGANNDISGRLLFREQNSTIALYNTGDTFSFRTGATVDSTSGTERVRIHSASIEMSTAEERLELGTGTGANFLRTSAGYLQLGPLNSGGCHIYTDREQFYFNKKLTIGVTAGNSIIRGYNPASTGTNGDIGFDRASNNTGRRQFLVKSGSTDHLFNGAVEFRLSESGDFHADGDVIAASTQISSDKRLKENIEDLPYGLNEVIKLRPVEFNWIKEKRDGKHDIGVIAQEVEDIIPEIVKETLHLPMEKNYKSVDYAKLAVVLVNAVKEQQVQIEELKEDINKLRGDD